MAETLVALRFKADLPARLGDSVGNAAVSFTEHVIDRVTAQDAEAEDQDREHHVERAERSSEGSNQATL